MFFIHDFVFLACTENGKPGKRLVCPTPKNGTRFWSCLLPSELCNGIQDCDHGEDEDPKLCMFYKAVRQQSILSEIYSFLGKEKLLNKS